MKNYLIAVIAMLAGVLMSCDKNEGQQATVTPTNQVASNVEISYEADSTSNDDTKEQEIIGGSESARIESMQKTYFQFGEDDWQEAKKITAFYSTSAISPQEDLTKFTTKNKKVWTYVANRNYTKTKSLKAGYYLLATDNFLSGVTENDYVQLQVEQGVTKLVRFAPANMNTPVITTGETGNVSIILSGKVPDYEFYNFEFVGNNYGINYGGGYLRPKEPGKVRMSVRLPVGNYTVNVTPQGGTQTSIQFTVIGNKTVSVKYKYK